ncbi:MAG: thymidine kinase [Putridiphycobacter sp.]|nr:thymidine kinase [Putridiphycobacter sp.]
MKISNKKGVSISLESHFTKREKNAQIRVICGPMFSGKTKTLIRVVNDYKRANKKVLVVKPKIDKRYANNHVVSHDKDRIQAIEITEPKKILDFILSVDVIAIDEVQFFDASIVRVCQLIAEKGKTCVVSGLDLDYKAQPFGEMPRILAIADEIIKLNSVCTFCSGPARFTHRISSELETVVLGEKDKYTPLCRSCYQELAVD